MSNMVSPPPSFDANLLFAQLLFSTDFWKWRLLVLHGLLLDQSAYTYIIFSGLQLQLPESWVRVSRKNSWVVSLCRDGVRTPPSLSYPVFCSGLVSERRVCSLCCMDRCSPLTSCGGYEMVAYSCPLAHSKGCNPCASSSSTGLVFTP